MNGEIKKRTILSILDKLDTISDLDEIISISRDHEENKERIEIKPTRKLYELFKINQLPSNSKIDLEEFRKQIAIQKDEYLRQLRDPNRKKNIKPQRKVKMQKKTVAMAQLFGDNIDQLSNEELKKTIKKKKDEYIDNIKKGRNIKTSKRRKSSLLPSAFDDDFQNMDISKLKIELDRRKEIFKKQINNNSIRDLAKDISYLQIVIDVLTDAHFELGNYKPSFIYRRIKRRLLRLQLETLEEYLHYIEKYPNEIEILKSELSINVTKFVRDRKTWDYLQSSIFPDLIKRYKNNLKFWSSATAIGAEAYSIAILMEQLNFSSYSIIATDINRELLDTAQKGMYHYSHLIELKKDEKIRYFTRKDETYRIIPRLKKKINFYKLDLFKNSFPNKLNIIFARNIWIYFDNPDDIYKKMYHSLINNGYLVLGGTETIPTHLRYLFKVISPKYQIYQKKSVTINV